MEANDVTVSDHVPLSSANVEGVFVGALSPITSSRNNGKVKYFEGQLFDGHKTVRFIYFEPKIRSQIEEAKEKPSAVVLKNCSVKRSRQPKQDLEVLVTSHTIIHNSPKKFKIDDEVIQDFEAGKCSDIKTLEELNSVAEHQYISVTGKITSLFLIEIIVKSNGKELKKMDFCWLIVLLFTDA